MRISALLRNIQFDAVQFSKESYISKGVFGKGSDFGWLHNLLL